MNPEDLRHSGLTLGLACPERPKDRKISQVEDDHYFPSLTLALSLEPVGKVDVESKSVILERQVSSISGVSSLSNTNFAKSKRDIILTSMIHEIEIERVVLDNDQDEDESGVRKKLKLDRYQSRILEDSFKDHSTLNLKQKQALARHLNLRPRQVEVWYQNRRARKKLKQTEMECEMMKKCYEALKDENRRLQKEVQQLKANLAIICPFCERITRSVSCQITL